MARFKEDTARSVRRGENIWLAFFRARRREGATQAWQLRTALARRHDRLYLFFVDIEIGKNVLHVVVLFQALD